MMETVLSILSSYPQPMLSFGSIFSDRDPIFTLCALGFLLLVLYLVWKLLTTIWWKKKPVKKQQGKVKTRKKVRPCKGWRSSKTGAEEARKLLSVLKSPPGHSHIIHLRQVLCPDQSCHICNRVTAEFNRLLFKKSGEDFSAYVSTVPVSESAQPQDSIPDPRPESPSPDLNTILDDFLSPSCDSMPPQPVSSLNSTISGNHFPPHSSAFSACPPHHTQQVDHVLQPETSLLLNTIFSLASLPPDMNPSRVSSDLTDSFSCHSTPATPCASPPPDSTVPMSQPKSISTLLRSFPESSAPEWPSSENPRQLDPCEVMVIGMNHSSLSLSELVSRPPHAREGFPSVSPQWDLKQEDPALYSSEVSMAKNLSTRSIEARNPFLPSPDALHLLDKQIKKRADFPMLKEKQMKQESFPEHLGRDGQVNSPGKIFGSISDKDDLLACVAIQDMEGKPKNLHIHEESLYPNAFGGNVQQRVQFFCGLPSLHSESLVSTLASAGDSLDTVSFNRPSSSLSLSEIQVQTLHQTWPQFLQLYLSQMHVNVHLPSKLPNLPSTPPETGIYRMSYSAHQEKLSLTQQEIHSLEWHVLQKKLESLFGKPSVVQRSQEAFCPPAPEIPRHHRPYKYPAPVTIITEDFPLSSEVRKLLDHHLRKRLTQHRWGLPRRIRESISLMRPPADSPETSESKSAYDLSWIREFQSQSSTDLSNEGPSYSKSFYEKALEMAHLEKMRNSQGNSPQTTPKKHLSTASVFSTLKPDSTNDPEIHRMSPSEYNSRASMVSQDQKLLEKALQTHMVGKHEQIKEGRIPAIVSGSRHAVDGTLSVPHKCHIHRNSEVAESSWHVFQKTLSLCKSPSQTKHRNVPPSLSKNYLNTFQELQFINSSTKERLEDHIKTFHMRMTQGLPCKVLKSIQIFTKSPSFFCSSSSDPSLAGKERQEALRLPTTDTDQELSVDLKIIKDGGHMDKISQSKTGIPSRCNPQLHIRQTRTGHSSRDKRMSSRDTEGILQGKWIVDKNSKHSSGEAKELHALQSQSSDITIPRQLVASQPKSMISSEVETNLITQCSHLPGISALQELSPSYLKRQVINELLQHSQGQVSLTDTSQKPLHIHMKPGETQDKAQMRSQAGPVQGPPLYS